MRVAAVQAPSEWLDKTSTTQKVITWLEMAHAEGVELVAFPEAFLSGYPFWISVTDAARFDDGEQKRAYAAYLAAAVEIPGPEMQQVTEAARDLGIFVYLGITERGRAVASGTVYCTLVAIDPQAGIVSSHRKLRPTYEERLVWGPGDGHGLRVHRMGDLRVGGLSCWENWMPLARHALYAGGEELHIATWPGGVRLTREITRFVAREGRVFVLSAGGLFTPASIPRDFAYADAMVEAGLAQGYDGGSAIAGPTGEWIVEPVAGEERLVIADLDPMEVRAERQNFDPTGHYSRPDVFAVTINRQRLSAASFVDEE